MRNRPSCRLAATLLAPVLALSLAGCANPLEAVSSALRAPSFDEALSAQRASMTTQVSSPAILEDGTLTVGIEQGSSVPMATLGADGAYQGYDVDIASAVASDLGLGVKFVEVGGSSGKSASDVDVVMAASADGTSTTASMTVVGSYAERATAFFARGGKGTVLAGELDGKTIGVQEGSTSQQLLKRSNLNVKQETFSNVNDAFDALESGGVDYVLCDAFTGAYLQAAYDGISLAGTIDVPTSVGIAVDSSNATLQKLVQDSIDKLESNGVVEVIRGKWLGSMGALSSDSQVQGVTLSSTVTTAQTSTTGTAETAATSDVATSTGAGSQDGSSAGANAVTMSD